MCITLLRHTSTVLVSIKRDNLPRFVAFRGLIYWTILKNFCLYTTKDMNTSTGYWQRRPIANVINIVVHWYLSTWSKTCDTTVQRGFGVYSTFFSLIKYTFCHIKYIQWKNLNARSSNPSCVCQCWIFRKCQSLCVGLSPDSQWRVFLPNKKGVGIRMTLPFLNKKCIAKLLKQGLYRI